MAGVKAVITLRAAGIDADDVSVTVKFDPPLDRQHPSFVAYCAVCALQALRVESDLAQLNAQTGTVGGGCLGVRSVGG